MSNSHILKKGPIALTYNRIVEGVTESNRSFMYLTWKNSKFDHDMLNCHWAGTFDTFRLVFTF